MRRMLNSILMASPLLFAVDASCQYQLVELGSVQGIYVEANDVTNNRLVSGQDLPRGFAWELGTMSLLQDPSPVALGAEAFGANSSGAIVGWADVLGVAGPRAVLWPSKSAPPVDLGSLRVFTSPIPFIGDYNRAHDINDLGEIVGEATTDLDLSHAFRYAVGQMTDLGAIVGSSAALGINSVGQCVGWSHFGFGVKVATRWTGTTLTSLGFLTGYTQSTATAINAQGDAVGYSFNKDSNWENRRACLFTASGSIVDLGAALGSGQSFAMDINDSGVVVGSMQIPTDSHEPGLAFLYDVNGCGVIDLNTFLPASGTAFVRLTEARSINANGDVVGVGYFSDFSQHGFLLRFDPGACASASVQSYGVGKAGTLGVPTLQSSSNPVLGTTSDLTIGNGLAGADPVFLFAGFAPLAIPFDGGTLLVNPFTVQILPPLPPSGSVTLPVPLPNCALFCGVNLFFQAGFVDPAAPGYYHTALTAGLQWTLGS